MSAAGSEVLPKFDSLQSLENYIKSVYYSNYSMALYVQVQLLKPKCTENTKAQFKMHWKVRERKNCYRWKKISPRTRKKIQGAKERDYRDPESRRQYRKRKYQENPDLEKEFEKKKYQENPKPKKEYEKKKYWENMKRRIWKKQICGQPQTKKKISKNK